MKKIIIISLTLSVILGINSVFAQTGMMSENYWRKGAFMPNLPENENTKKILNDILKSQNTDDINKLDCGKISENQLDELGDSYMGLMLSNAEQHETMDAIMGGEGSPHLKQAHINMGRSYLGCWGNYSYGPMRMPMMMGGYGMGGYFGIPMQWGGYNFTNQIITVAIWVLAAIGLVSIIKLAAKNNKKEK